MKIRRFLNTSENQEKALLVKHFHYHYHYDKNDFKNQNDIRSQQYNNKANRYSGIQFKNNEYSTR